MWIKINDRKFWLVRILEPVKTAGRYSPTGYCRIVVKDRPEDKYNSAIDLYYDSRNIQYCQYIIHMYNPDTVFTVYDDATISMVYSAICTRLALEAL